MVKPGPKPRSDSQAHGKNPRPYTSQIYCRKNNPHTFTISFHLLLGLVVALFTCFSWGYIQCLFHHFRSRIMCLWYKQGFKMCPLHKLIKEISFHVDSVYGTSLGKKVHLEISLPLSFTTLQGLGKLPNEVQSLVHLLT